MKKIVAISLTLFASQAFATGYSKPVNVGAKAMGMGGAFVAVADDTTAIFHNPAGMSQLKKDHNLQLGVDTMFAKLRYEPIAAPVEMSDSRIFPLPNFGYVNRQLGPVSFGLGLYMPHGNGNKFSVPASNPTDPNEGMLYSMEIDPAVSFEVIKGLSLGASLRITRISLNIKGQPLQLAPAVFDMLNEIDVSGWTYGAAAGFLAQPTDWLSIGGNYRSKVSKKLSGNGDLATLGAFDADIDVTLPTLITGGFAAQATDRLLLSFQYGFERNSEVKAFTVTSPDIGGAPATLPIAQNWKDSHTYHFGMKYDVLKTLGIVAGYARDFNASIPGTTISRVSGDFDCHETSAGLIMDLGRYNAGLAWNGRWGSHVYPTGPGINAPGRYQAFLHTISANVGFSL
ncbi:MAG: outer membrane protein transport protein [Proteobacteria bacterium]|jgi:long-chain fatty acid transport protein|nr:outer membrane protein transport protein [Pseudomonadota bacterium]